LCRQLPFDLILRKRFSAVSKDGQLVRSSPPILRDAAVAAPQDEGKFLKTAPFIDIPDGATRSSGTGEKFV